MLILFFPTGTEASGVKPNLFITLPTKRTSTRRPSRCWKREKGKAMTEELAEMRCVACRRDAPLVTQEEIKELLPQIPDWQIVERDDIKRLERVFRFDNFA